MKYGKRISCVLAALCVVFGTQARAAETTEHIRTKIETTLGVIDVDAQVYGWDIERVQAFKVTEKNWGKNPEEDAALKEVFPFIEKSEKTTWWTKEDVRLSGADGQEIGVSPWSASYVSERAKRMREGVLWDVPFYWIDYKENLTIDEFEDFPLAQALVYADEAAAGFGVSLCGIVDGLCVNMDVLSRETLEIQEAGFAPYNQIITDWTREDEHYRLALYQTFHNLSIFPQQAFTGGVENTPSACVGMLIGREGVEEIVLDFIPGKERAMGEAFVPMAPRDALEAAIKALVEREEMIDEIRVREMRLCYVPLPVAGSSTEYTVMPAWSVLFFYEEKNPEMPAGTGCTVMAIDAQTGELIAWH